MVRVARACVLWGVAGVAAAASIVESCALDPGGIALESSDDAGEVPAGDAPSASDSSSTDGSAPAASPEGGAGADSAPDGADSAFPSGSDGAADATDAADASPKLDGASDGGCGACGLQSVSAGGPCIP